MIKNSFKFIFGVLAVLIGLAIYGWVFYNMFFPTVSFKKSAGLSVGQYIFPGIMIIFGVKWVRESLGRDS